jgi:hypothetical protein
MTKAAMICVVAATLLGCATVRLPPEQLERSEAGIRSAAELGAEKVPAAKLHLQLARDQTEAAKKLAADGDSRALTLLARAEADAELSLVLAREAAVHEEAAKADAQLKALQNRAAE